MQSRALAFLARCSVANRHGRGRVRLPRTAQWSGRTVTVDPSAPIFARLPFWVCTRSPGGALGHQQCRQNDDHHPASEFAQLKQTTLLGNPKGSTHEEWGLNTGGKGFPERSRSSGMISRAGSAQIKLRAHFSGGRHA
jgi:hypothetical protein